MNNPLNSPVMRLIGMARQGADPRQVVRQMAMQDPRAAQVDRILGGKTQEQQRTIVENMAKERGIDLGQMAQSLGLKLPE